MGHGGSTGPHVDDAALLSDKRTGTELMNTPAREGHRMTAHVRMAVTVFSAL